MLPRFMNYSIFIYILFMLWASPSEPSFLLRKSQERRITTTDVIDLTFWLGFISLVRGLPEGCVIVIFSILPCPMHQEKGLADLGGLLLCPVCTYFLSERAKAYFGAKPWLCSALFDWWSILASPYLEEFLWSSSWFSHLGWSFEWKCRLVCVKPPNFSPFFLCSISAVNSITFPRDWGSLAIFHWRVDTRQVLSFDRSLLRAKLLALCFSSGLLQNESIVLALGIYSSLRWWLPEASWGLSRYSFSDGFHNGKSKLFSFPHLL